MATRRKKAVTEAPVTAEEPATTDDTKTDDTNRKTVTIDTKSGHVGITCENHELEPLGVLLTKCDTIDLAFKAGLREGDVVTSVNGVPVTDHEALIASINRATFSPNGELKLEYQTAATVAATQAALAKERPPRKSMFKAYLLWLFFPPLGLHHFYLGRDAHAALHCITLSGFIGIGWLRDLFLIPHYTSVANEEPTYIAELKATQRLKPKPRNGWLSARFLAMWFIGSRFAWFAGDCVPAQEETVLLGHAAPNFLYIALEILAKALAASLCVYAIGTHPPHTARFRPAFIKALQVGGVCAFIWPQSSGIWATMGAIRGLNQSLEWRPLRPQRRMKLTVRRRAALVICGVGSAWGMMLFALYQNGGVYADTPQGKVWMPIKDAVHNFIASPFVRNFRSTLWTAFTAEKGWQEAFEKIKKDLDFAGAATACETLGLEGNCLEAFSSVKRAYRQLALESHPDKHAGASEEEMKEIEERFRIIQEAYEKLTKLNQQNKREAGGGGAAPEDV